MITRLTQQFKVTCDRCGKETFCDEINPPLVYEVAFCTNENIRTYRSGHICSECRKDFCEIAENFFDEVNKDE